MQLTLIKQSTNAASVSTLADQGWHLEIPAGKRGGYRLAQLDDYANRSRKDFLWHPPLTTTLLARASYKDIPGTWGFGLWNDPFSLSLGLSGGVRRFPALPNTAWFFHASLENHLSFQKDKPAQGFLAQTFNSPPMPPGLLALAAPVFPLLTLPWIAKRIRPVIARVIKDDSTSIYLDVTQWHQYALQLEQSLVRFKIDNVEIFQTKVAPISPLGFVIWIDNQFASFPPTGKLAYGTMENSRPAWIEVKQIEIIK
jgi:hypothetical protein